MNRAIRATLGHCLRRVYRKDLDFAVHTLIDDDVFDYKTDLAERLHAEFRRHKAYANRLTVRDVHDELADLLEGAEDVAQVSFMDNHTYIEVSPKLVRDRWNRLPGERSLILDLRPEPDARSELLIDLLRLLRDSELVRVDLTEAYRTLDYAQRQALVSQQLRAFEGCSEQVEVVVNHRLFDLRHVHGRVHQVFPSRLSHNRYSLLYLNKLDQGVSRTIEVKSSWAEEFVQGLEVPAAADSEELRKLVVKLYDDLLEVVRVDGSQVHAQVSRRAAQLVRAGRWHRSEERLGRMARRLLNEIL